MAASELEANLIANALQSIPEENEEPDCPDETIEGETLSGNTFIALTYVFYLKNRSWKIYD